MNTNHTAKQQQQKIQTKGDWFCSTKWVLKSLIESSKKKKKKLMKNLRNNLRVEKGVDVGAHRVDIWIKVFSHLLTK